jgi:hypothetical protein
MEIVVMMVLMEMLTEMPPPKPRRSGDVDGVDFPFTGGTGAAGSALSRSRRTFASAAASINLGKNMA